jgi:hypothetical protein
MPRSSASFGAAVIVVAGVLLSSAVSTHGRESDFVRVTAIEERAYGRVAYRYSVENNSRSRTIVSLRVGEDSGRPRAELRQPPYGWSDDKGLPIGSALAPDGWTVEAVREDEEQLWFVEWFTSETDETLDIAPGEMRDGFLVVLFDSAPEYLSSHWTVVFDNGERRSGRLEPDTR